MTTTQNKKKGKAIAVLAWALLIVAVPACKDKPSHAATVSEAKEQAIPVSTWPVTEKLFVRTVEITADVIPRISVVLNSKIPGEVAKVHVVEGDRVKKGDALVELDRIDYRLGMRQAEAQLAAAKAGLSAAETGFDSISRKYKRFAVLHQRKSVSENEFDDISSGKSMTLSKLQGSRAQLQLAQVALDMAKTNFARTVIRSPFDGVIVQRMIDEGARLHAMPPSPVLMIADLDRIKVVGSVGQRDLPDTKKGAPVEIYVDAFGAKPIQAVVDLVEPMLDPRTRTAKVQVFLPNPPDPAQPDKRLHPGMSARMAIKLESRKSPGIPDDTVTRNKSSERNGFVYVVREGKAYRREVVLGAHNKDLVQIISGLASGEVIVRSGQENLYDGRQVTVSEEGGS